MGVTSTFYDGKSGKLMTLRDVSKLELPNPMDATYGIQKNPMEDKNTKKDYEGDFQIAKERIIREDFTERRSKQLVKAN